MRPIGAAVSAINSPSWKCSYISRLFRPAGQRYAGARISGLTEKPQRERSLRLADLAIRQLDLVVRILRLYNVVDFIARSAKALVEPIVEVRLLRHVRRAPHGQPKL
jgi:hypothetical protein